MAANILIDCHPSHNFILSIHVPTALLTHGFSYTIGLYSFFFAMDPATQSPGNPSLVPTGNNDIPATAFYVRTTQTFKTFFYYYKPLCA